MSAIFLVDDIEEVQPVFYHKDVLWLHSLVYVCMKCGWSWGKCVIISEVRGGVHDYQARQTHCETCNDGSVFQYPCRWQGFHQDPFEQTIGPQMLQRELRLAQTRNQSK